MSVGVASMALGLTVVWTQVEDFHAWRVMVVYLHVCGGCQGVGTKAGALCLACSGLGGVEQIFFSPCVQSNQVLDHPLARVIHVSIREGLLATMRYSPT